MHDHKLYLKLTSDQERKSRKLFPPIDVQRQLSIIDSCSRQAFPPIDDRLSTEILSAAIDLRRSVRYLRSGQIRNDSSSSSSSSTGGSRHFRIPHALFLSSFLLTCRQPIDRHSLPPEFASIFHPFFNSPTVLSSRLFSFPALSASPPPSYLLPRKRPDDLFVVLPLQTTTIPVHFRLSSIIR